MSATYTVERSRTVDAPPERVLPLLEDFHAWQRWSPFEGLDPDLQRSYDGTGVGSSYAWSGNRRAGKGRMQLLAVEPEKVEVALHFDKPFRSDNVLVFLLEPHTAGTRVTWRMTGPRPLAMRLAGPLLSMEKVIGPDFERGLDNLAREATRA